MWAWVFNLLKKSLSACDNCLKALETFYLIISYTSLTYSFSLLSFFLSHFQIWHIIFLLFFHSELYTNSSNSLLFFSSLLFYATLKNSLFFFLIRYLFSLSSLSFSSFSSISRTKILLSLSHSVTETFYWKKGQ